MEETTKQNKFLYRVFELSIFIKGIDGLLEMIGGFLLFFISQKSLNQIVVLVTQHELIEDSKDFIANYLVNLIYNLSVNTQLFIATYLICHGVIKVFLVASLFKNKLWAYPTAITFFIIFIIYETYRYFLNYSTLLLFLTIFDIFIVVLISLEYKRIKKLRTI